MMLEIKICANVVVHVSLQVLHPSVCWTTGIREVLDMLHASNVNINTDPCNGNNSVFKRSSNQSP